MGKTWRKDGRNRNKHFIVRKKGSSKKPINSDYEKMIEEYNKDKENPDDQK